MRPRWILILCAVTSLGIVGYASLSSSGATRVRAQERELTALESDVKALSDGNDALRREAEQLRGETEATRPYLEQAVREELGYVRDDERVVLLDTAAPPVESGPAEENSP